MNNTNILFFICLTQILISKKFEKEIVFESSVLAWIRIRNWIRIEKKCWIRFRTGFKSNRIHNPAYKYRYQSKDFQVALWNEHRYSVPANTLDPEVLEFSCHGLGIDVHGANALLAPIPSHLNTT
jgi:hypothetical protein